MTWNVIHDVGWAYRTSAWEQTINRNNDHSERDLIFQFSPGQLLHLNRDDRCIEFSRNRPLAPQQSSIFQIDIFEIAIYSALGPSINRQSICRSILISFSVTMKQFHYYLVVQDILEYNLRERPSRDMKIINCIKKSAHSKLRDATTNKTQDKSQHWNLLIISR